MFALSHLFYPWGFIVQIVALIHFFRRRPEGYWFYIIVFGGFVGSAAYLVIEGIPDLGLLKGTFQGFGRRTRIQKLETDTLDNPPPRILKNSARCISTKRNLKNRAKRSRRPSPRAAIRPTHFICVEKPLSG